MKLNDTIDFSAAREILERRGIIAITEIAHELATEAVFEAPEDTGDLKRSITVQPGEDKFSLRVVVGVYYAKFVEFGFIHYISRAFISPNPFFRRAIDNVRIRFKQIVVTIVSS